jgi:glucose-6-phosphate 1-dehydrogenase
VSHTVIPVDIFDYVVFGATGDLSRKKLLPALYYRFADGQIPDDSRIIACARTNVDKQAFRLMAEDAIKDSASSISIDESVLERFLCLLHYQVIDVFNDDDWSVLKTFIALKNDDRVTVFYLSVDPSLIDPIVSGLKMNQLHTTSRLVIEKPLGFDLPSSVHLNTLLRSVYDENRIYRIDHYLGKETVQNLMALRFANIMFEPLWNSHYIDHVQITAAEKIGVQGRGGYYDTAGALRDMVQNHILQVICLSTMEPPATFDADSVRDEKLKVLQSLKPLTNEHMNTNAVRGQYAESAEYSGYLQDVDKKSSQTETYVALQFYIDNWRWAGTPFYLRTGKRLSDQAMEIVFVFRKMPHFIFGKTSQEVQQNALVIRLQPDESIDIEITTKDPGHGGMRLKETTLETAPSTSIQSQDAYQRLLMEVGRGDQTLFMRGDEVEAAWQWIDPIIEYWKQSERPVDTYTAGSEGPESANELMKKSDRVWRKIQ